MYVDIKDKEKRKTFLYFLEGKGFESFHFTREHIVEGKLPFDVNLNTKKFTMVGNVTCASAIKKENLITIDEAIDIINSMK